MKLCSTVFMQLSGFIELNKDHVHSSTVYFSQYQITHVQSSNWRKIPGTRIFKNDTVAAY